MNELEPVLISGLQHDSIPYPLSNFFKVQFNVITSCIARNHLVFHPASQRSCIVTG
jgi:hypothetical protein